MPSLAHSTNIPSTRSYSDIQSSANSTVTQSIANSTANSTEIQNSTVTPRTTISTDIDSTVISTNYTEITTNTTIERTNLTSSTEIPSTINSTETSSTVTFTDTPSTIQSTEIPSTATFTEIPSTAKSTEIPSTFGPSDTAPLLPSSTPDNNTIRREISPEQPSLRDWHYGIIGSGATFGLILLILLFLFRKKLCNRTKYNHMRKRSHSNIKISQRQKHSGSRAYNDLVTKDFKHGRVSDNIDDIVAEESSRIQMQNFQMGRKPSWGFKRKNRRVSNVQTSDVTVELSDGNTIEKIV